MGDKDTATDMANRLNVLRAMRGTTIQKMADACGLPKSSMESYMRASNARKPGLDALISIADGLDVSVDWLVGRSEQISSSLSDEDQAIACFNMVLGLLNWQAEMASQFDGDLFEGGKFAGREVEEIAAKSMLVFTRNLNNYRNNSSFFKSGRIELYETLEMALRQDHEGTTK